jgi:hypothetical protein
MDRDRTPADAADAMKTLLRHQQRAGRFGREVPSEEAQMGDVRTTMENDDDRFETFGYVVDADAVADAIVSRLLAGRTLR